MGSGVLRNLAGDFNNLEGASKKAAQQQMQTGSSLMAVGVAIGAVGAAGLVFLGKATSAAIEYNRQVALTKTQMFGVKATFEQVSEAGLATARSIAVPLDQIQGGLYDIFSSMDVNLTQAKFLLNNFSKEAVAGQVDLSTAERATIGIMNAYQMKVRDVTKVQDIMFNLVKYGVGTYGDFARSIGRVTGPAVRQNQTFEQTAALMAFVTRNGLSASQAASTVGRALDALGKSRDKIQSLGATVEDALGLDVAHKLGFTHDQMIKVTDAAGKMLPINQIMTNLGMALKGLNPTQLNDVLTTMFKGTGGTIQAMRFFDIAIHNFGQLNTMVGNMGKSKGALKAAYDIMSNTPAAKIQLLKNNFQAFMIVLGQAFLPIVGKVAAALATFFKFMGTLPKPLLTIIAIVIAVVSVMLLLTGIVFVAIGAWLIFSAILAATEIALAPIILTIGLIIAAVAALAIAAYLIYHYWDPISKWFHDMWFDIWHWIDHVLQVIGKSLSDAWSAVTRVTVDAWNKVYGAIKGAWDKITGIFSGITSWISSNFDGWWKTHGDAVKKVWSTMWGGIVDTTKAYWNMTTAIFKVAVNVLKQIWGGIVDLTKSAWDIISGIFKVAWAIISTIFKLGMDYLKLATQTGWDIIKGIFRIAWAVILAAFKIWFAVMTAVVKIAWAGIKSVMKIAWDVIVAVFSVFLDVITGHWHQALVDIRNLGVQIWNSIKGFLVQSWNAIRNAAIPIFNALKQMFFSIWHSVYDTTQSVWHNITKFLNNVWGDIKSGARNTVSGLSSIWHGIENVFKVPVNFVIGTVYDNGIRRLWNDVMGAIGLKRFNLPNIPMMAAGGKLAGFGGGDRIPALLEAGETVVDKNRSRKWAWVFSMMGVPGYATGGQIPPAVARFGQSVNPTGPALGPLTGILHLAGAAGKMLLAAATGNSEAFSNALIGALGIKSGAGSQLASMAATLPVAMAKKAIAGLWHTITGSASGAGVNYKAGAGVQQWRGLVLRALGMEGLSPSLVGAVLYQMQTESGGNPRAINLTDINAQHGDPSRGLMQTIMSTFLAYHWPGTSFDIYNPLANIAAALNYAAHGRGFGSGVGQLGSGHGYALGTNWASPGRRVVGENGPEVVSFRGGEKVTPGGQTIIIYTNEIDPRRHAAELGWELARRSA
jgi:TP901 family phage tail tape measure protein